MSPKTALLGLVFCSFSQGRQEKQVGRVFVDI